MHCNARKGLFRVFFDNQKQFIDSNYAGLRTSGYNNNLIQNCYATGGVTGSSAFGGLVGVNWGSGILSSYFDVDIGGPDNGYGTGVSTVLMQTQTTFVGWDFVGEGVNGIEDVWRLCVDGSGYPVLNFEQPGGDFDCPDGVGFEDLLYFVGYWQDGTLGAYEGGDLTGDGEVTLVDWAIFAGHFLEGR